MRVRTAKQLQALEHALMPKLDMIQLKKPGQILWHRQEQMLMLILVLSQTLEQSIQKCLTLELQRMLIMLFKLILTHLRALCKT